MFSHTLNKSNLLQNFKEGDLLYGLNSVRKLIASDIKQKVGNSVGVTIDEYNNPILYRLVDGRFNFEPKKPDHKEVMRWLEDEAKTIPEFTSPIKHSFFKKHVHALLNAPYDKVKINRNEFPVNDKKLELESRLLKRTCKARLLDSDITVHFLLDKLSAEAIFDPNNIHYNSYTSAELRFVLKHFDKISLHIKFYDKQREVDLFQWLSEQCNNTKCLISKWACSRKNKLSMTVFNKLNMPVTMEDEKLNSTTINITPPASPIFSPLPNHSFQTPPRSVSPNPPAKRAKLRSFVLPAATDPVSNFTSEMPKFL